MMELLVTVMGERIHTMEIARITETGLMFNRVSILVTGMRLVVNSPAKVVVVDDLYSGVSVTSVDIVTLNSNKRIRTYSCLRTFLRVKFFLSYTRTLHHTALRHDANVIEIVMSQSVIRDWLNKLNCLLPNAISWLKK